MADWCPACEERTSLTDSGLCPFCDTPLVEKAKRGGWKRPDRAAQRKLTEAHVRALYRAYSEQGVSVNALARKVWQRCGFASPGSCASNIYQRFGELGLPCRDRIEAVKLACVTHGQGARDRDEQAYRRFIRDQRGWNSLQGPGRPDCKGVKRQPPGKGQPCTRHAMEGSQFCAAHDPAREFARQVTLAKMRRRLPQVEMLPIGPFALWLRALVAEHGTMAEVARQLDGPYTALCQYVKCRGTDKQPKHQIARATVERYTAAAGTTVEAIYDLYDIEAMAA